jgi:hypothetical protein
MKSLRLSAALALTLVTFSQHSHAGELVWTNTSGGNWSTAANWSPNAVPTATDSAFITNSGNYTVTVNASATVARLTLGDTNATGLQKLTVNAGTFTITNLTAATNSILLLSAGTLVTAGTAELLGEVNQAGGTWQLTTPINLNTYNLTNGELRGANCVITNFNWFGGQLNSDAFGTTITVPAGGTLNIFGATAKSMSYWVAPGRALINHGTATWSGAGISTAGGVLFINNGSLTLNGDFALVGSGGNPPTLQNSGTLTKATGSGNFSLSTAVLNNSGTVNVDAGSLNISGQLLNSGVINVATGTLAVASTFANSTNTGTLTLGANAFADFNSGTTTLGGALVSPTANHLRFNGGTVNLSTTNLTTPALLLAGAVLNQNTNIAVNELNQSSGTWQLNTPTVINNYNLTNGELRGANNTITNFNWFGGQLNSDALGTTTTVASGGTLNIAGATAKSMSYWVAPGRTLVNLGTANWSGAGISAAGGAVIANNGTLTLGGDFSLVNAGGNPPVLRNYSTLILSSGADFTLSSAVLDNQPGAGIYFHNGSITVSGSGIATNSGLLNLDATSFFQHSGATLLLGGTVNAPVANSLRLAGTETYIATTNLNTPSLWQQAGTVYQNTNVVVNAYNQQAGTFRATLPVAFNNYSLTNGEIRGANLTITNFNWLGGQLNADGAGSDAILVPTGGTLNIASPTAKSMSYWVAPGRTLFNNGTAIWSGAGISAVGGATLANNGTLTLAGDFSFVNAGGNAPVLRNYTTLILSNGADFTLSSAVLDNRAGAGIYFNNGSITVSGSGITTNSGLLNLDSGSFFQFSGATLELGGTVNAPANNSLRFAGTAAYIITTNIASPSLWQQAGTIYQATNVVVNTFNQQAGTFSATLPVAWNNYNMTNAELRGANVIITNFVWLGGALNSENASSNSVTIPPTGTLTISGPTAKSLSDYSGGNGRRLVNQGAGTWSGAGISGAHGCQLNNSGTLALSGDFSYVNAGGTGLPQFNNTGTMNLNSGADFTLTSAILHNTATVNFTNGSITLASSSIATNNGLLNLDATSYFQFSGATLQLGGEVIAPGNNSLRFAGTAAYVITTNIASPSFWLQAGTIYQATNVVVNALNQQNGTFYGTLPVAWNNYNMTNGELRGANVIITNFVWLGGALNSENASSNSVTIPPTGTLTISGPTAKSLSDYSGGNGRRLVNQGTGTWSGAGISGAHGCQFNNSGTLALTGDFSYVNAGGTGLPQLNNTGTLNLNSGADFTLTSAIFNNASNVNLTAGSLTIAAISIATNTGTLTLDATSFFQFSGATLNLGGSVNSPGANSLRFAGTAAYVTTTDIAAPSYWLQAGTIYQTTNFVVNALNQQNGTFYGTLPLAFPNYNMTNGELRGANVTITNFAWLGGQLNSENAGSNTVTIPTGGTLNISSATAKGFSDYSGGNGRRLIHRGTGLWSGASLGMAHGARFINQGSLTLTNDAGLTFTGGTGTPSFENAGGTFIKTNAAGVSSFTSVNVTNTGTFNIARGGFTVSGVFHQTGGTANLGTNFSASANVRIDAGTFAGRGNIAGTFYNNGLSSAGASLGLITGTSWTNAATGTIRFEIGGTNPGTNFDQFRLSGPATVNGTADLALANGFVPVPGNTFTCIVTTARSGVFTNLIFSGGYEFSALYTPTTVVFRAENALPTVNLTVLNGNTQFVCTPFKLLATASDVGGAITNLSIAQDGSTFASANSGSVTGTAESDFPLDVTFVAQAIDDQGGKSYATQTVSLATFPLHVLQLGGKRPNGVFKFCMVGETGSNYMVLATTNIAEPSANWTQLGLMENTNGIWRYYDNGTLTNRPYRFYRAQQQ